MKVSQRLAGAAAAALTVVAITGAPAVAAPPGNDVYGGAEPVLAIPFSDLPGWLDAVQPGRTQGRERPGSGRPHRALWIGHRVVCQKADLLCDLAHGLIVGHDGQILDSASHSGGQMDRIE